MAAAVIFPASQVAGLLKVRYGARSGPSKFEGMASWRNPPSRPPRLPAAYQPLPPPPEPLDEPGAVEEAAMAPEKLPPRLEAKPETPCSWKPRPEYQRGR